MVDTTFWDEVVSVFLLWFLWSTLVFKYGCLEWVWSTLFKIDGLHLYSHCTTKCHRTSLVSTQTKCFLSEECHTQWVETCENIDAAWYKSWCWRTYRKKEIMPVPRTGVHEGHFTLIVAVSPYVNLEFIYKARLWNKCYCIRLEVGPYW